MICQQCGVEFSDNTGRRKYCSQGCYHKSHRIDKKCPCCGAWVKCQNQKYCGWDCFVKDSKGKSKPHRPRLLDKASGAKLNTQTQAQHEAGLQPADPANGLTANGWR